MFWYGSTVSGKTEVGDIDIGGGIDELSDGGTGG
jgi:hypothetical protein